MPLNTLGELLIAQVAGILQGRAGRRERGAAMQLFVAVAVAVAAAHPTRPRCQAGFQTHVPVLNRHERHVMWLKGA